MKRVQVVTCKSSRVVDHYPDTQAYTNSHDPEIMKKSPCERLFFPQISDFES